MGAMWNSRQLATAGLLLCAATLLSNPFATGQSTTTDGAVTGGGDAAANSTGVNATAVDGDGVSLNETTAEDDLGNVTTINANSSSANETQSAGFNATDADVPLDGGNHTAAKGTATGNDTIEMAEEDGGSDNSTAEPERDGHNRTGTTTAAGKHTRGGGDGGGSTAHHRRHTTEGHGPVRSSTTHAGADGPADDGGGRSKPPANMVQDMIDLLNKHGWEISPDADIPETIEQLRELAAKKGDTSNSEAAEHKGKGAGYRPKPEPKFPPPPDKDLFAKSDSGDSDFDARYALIPPPPAPLDGYEPPNLAMDTAEADEWAERNGADGGGVGGGPEPDPDDADVVYMRPHISNVGFM